MNRWERKEKIGFGGISAVARALHLSTATVSLVISDKTDNISEPTILRVREAIAARIGRSVNEVFPPSETAAA